MNKLLELPKFMFGKISVSISQNIRSHWVLFNLILLSLPPLPPFPLFLLSGKKNTMHERIAPNFHKNVLFDLTIS